MCVCVCLSVLQILISRLPTLLSSGKHLAAPMVHIYKKYVWLSCRCLSHVLEILLTFISSQTPGINAYGNEITSVNYKHLRQSRVNIITYFIKLILHRGTDTNSQEVIVQGNVQILSEIVMYQKCV